MLKYCGERYQRLPLKSGKENLAVAFGVLGPSRKNFRDRLPIRSTRMEANIQTFFPVETLLNCGIVAGKLELR